MWDWMIQEQAIGKPLQKNNSRLVDLLLSIIFQGDQTMAPLSNDMSPSTYELSSSSYIVSLLFTSFSSISKVV
jgi:hypothetical protein